MAYVRNMLQYIFPGSDGSLEFRLPQKQNKEPHGSIHSSWSGPIRLLVRRHRATPRGVHQRSHTKTKTPAGVRGMTEELVACTRRMRQMDRGWTWMTEEEELVAGGQ